MFDSKLYSVTETISNYFLLNLLWVLASIPIVTLFPATAAMFGVIKDWSIKKETGVFKQFFKHFKRHFKQSFVLGLFLALFMLIFIIDFTIMGDLSNVMRVLVFSLLALMGILILFISTFLFPIMVRYNLPIGKLIKNAFLFSIMYFPSTILSITIFITAVFIAVVMPFTCFVVFSPTAYFVFKLCNRTFNKVAKVLDTEKDDQGAFSA